MKLFYHPVSAYSRKALLTVYEKDIAFEPEIVDLFDAGAREQYRREHGWPGKVPLLVLDNGDAVSESSIIMEYLCTHYDSGPELLSRDLEKARQARYFDRIGDLYVINPVVANLFERMKPSDQQSAASIQDNEQILANSFNMLDRVFANRDFVLGDEFGYGDIAASSGCYWLTIQSNQLDDYRNVKQWYNRVIARPSWQRILAESHPFLQLLQQRLGHDPAA